MVEWLFDGSLKAKDDEKHGCPFEFNKIGARVGKMDYRHLEPWVWVYKSWTLYGI